MAITRRRLLQMLGVAAGAPLVTLAFWRARQASAPDVRPGPFPYLKLDPAALESFAADYQRHVGRALAPGRWSDRVQAQFLLSTDFFRFDADESRVISYVGYYDASVTPCNNPLARFD